MNFLKVKKKTDDRLKRIEELEEKIKELKKPSYQPKIERPIEIKQIPQLERKEPEKILPEKEFIDEVHAAVKEGVQLGTIKIDTTVKDIMTTDVKTVEPEDDLRKVLSILSEYRITGVPVVSKNKIVGVVSQSDIIKIMDERKILDPQRDVVQLFELEKLRVNDIMSKNPIVINQKEKITDASDMMCKHDVERLPVVDDKNELVGIITREDIIRGMTNEFFVKSIEAGGIIIQTNIDKLIDIVENRGLVTVNGVSEELGVPPDQVEEWAKILEERGMIEIEYPPLGSPRLRKKK